ncbi:hypothetical protein CPLU01_01569 [Colletotrichum plurivorum]|uniref:Uncharacterized protein n=1 Tax=Colletotrichum plurivorum TaxID=2175906 RepID=A0A8H6KXW1_9PEZI|nr:hypothetical protein CPLU01_01569 [Colletotrichum plurivorum]
MEGGPRRDGCGDNSATSEPGAKVRYPQPEVPEEYRKGCDTMDEDENQDRQGDWLMEKEAAWTRALDDVEESGTARMGKDGH